MGIPCQGPAYILGDNQSVLANTSIPDSTLKKKSQSINTHENEADLLTKLLPSGDKRKRFVETYCTISFDLRELVVKQWNRKEPNH